MSQSSLNRQRQDWEDLGALDPYWAILAHPMRKFGKWKLEEFFRTGEEEIERIMEVSHGLGYPRQRDLALDFGCGVGRLTRALAKHFRRCHGVDISEAMIARARELNRSIPNCEFTVNAEGHLGMFPDDHFDMVCSLIVLQHLPDQRAIRTSISEFMRAVKRNGLVVFQLPSHIPLKRRLQPRRRLYGLLRSLGFDCRFLYDRLGLYPLRMNFIPEREVLVFLRSVGGHVLDVRPEPNPSAAIESNTYYVTKHEPPVPIGNSRL